MAALFCGGILAFVVLRFFLVPSDFGLFGHYRAGAVDDAAAPPLVFAGHGACADCHTDAADALKESKHAAIGCEACHGPLAKHAGDPSAQAPAKLGAPARCLGCHAASRAKPKTFPQVDAKTHGEGEACASCHGPHAPEKGPA